MFDLDSLYGNEILPFAKAQENLTFITGSECINCCGKNYLSIRDSKYVGNQSYLPLHLLRVHLVQLVELR